MGRDLALSSPDWRVVIHEGEAVSVRDQVGHIVLWTVGVDCTLLVQQVMDGLSVIQNNHSVVGQFDGIHTAICIAPFF